MIKRDKRDLAEVTGEIKRSRANGFRKVKGFADRCAEIGAIATHIRCDCDQPPVKMPMLTRSALVTGARSSS